VALAAVIRQKISLEKKQSTGLKPYEKRDSFVDSLTLTIIGIFLLSGIIAFIRARVRDRCLKNFRHDPVLIEQANGKCLQGKLEVESTGLELIYEKPYSDNDGHIELSFIIYKSEYTAIQNILRLRSSLSEKCRIKLEKEQAKISRSGIFRKIKNGINTIRDSVLDILGLFIGQAKKSNSFGKLVQSQDKYAQSLKTELVNQVGTAFEPLMEKYIGKRVVLEYAKDDSVTEYVGILKDYSSEFIELLAVHYKVPGTEEKQQVDIIFPRRISSVRHLSQ
jgi:small nuclear ribonucleoprotein (snRNP)-like protein